MRTDYIYNVIANTFNEIITEAETKTTVPFTGERFVVNSDWRLDSASSKLNKLTEYLVAEGVLLEADSRLFGVSDEWVYSQINLYFDKISKSISEYVAPVVP